MTLHAEVKGFHCEPDGVSLFGQIKSGWIKLKTSVLECFRMADGTIILAVGGSTVSPKITFFFDEEPLEGQIFSFLMVKMAECFSADEDSWENILLITQDDKADSCFKRIGVALCKDCEYTGAPNWTKQLHIITIM
jgi:hypothetical protein